MSTSFLKEKIVLMPNFLNKLAEDNSHLINKNVKEKKYGTEEIRFHENKAERITAQRREEVVKKESNFEKIENEITSSLNYLLNNGYSIDEVQSTLSNKYSSDISKRYINKNASYILKAYGVLGNICLDSNSFENNIKISDYISKISSKHPIQIKFIISKDKTKFSNIGYKIIDSIDEVKLSSDEAKEIISKISNDEVYFKAANKNPLESVKAAYRDFIENKRTIKKVTKEITKPQKFNSAAVDNKKNDAEKNKQEKISKLISDRKSFRNELTKIASAVVDTIESGKQIVLDDDQFTEKNQCSNFKTGFENLTNEVFKVFKDKYGVKLSHIGIASSFLIKAKKCLTCNQNKNGICILTGIKQLSSKNLVKTANYNFNGALEPYNMKLSDLPDNSEEIYEIDAQKVYS